MDISRRALHGSSLLSAAVFFAGLVCLPAGLQPAWSASEAPAGDQPAADSHAAASKEGLDWKNDFDTALEEAKEEQKFVLVDVYTDWCVYCKKLDKEVYTNPAIAKYLAEKFIVVRANAEDNAQGEAFANKFDAHAYPTILVFDYKGKNTKPKARIFGYLAPNEFDTALHTIVESKKFKQKHSKT